MEKISASRGPLAGLRVIEVAGLGPVPFAAMVLGDLGAEVIRIDREPVRREGYDPKRDLVNRGRRSIAIDLTKANGTAIAMRLIETASVLLEGFRPSVMERLGLGPRECLERNSRLIYGRMTGWGVGGPLSGIPGHDISYVAMTGALEAFRRSDQFPTIPLNLVGDYAGGGMLLVIGVLAGLFETSKSGEGQVVDAAMLDGVAVLSTLIFGEMAQGRWDDRGKNFLQSAAPWYEVYETADNRFVAVGALEHRFYKALLQVLGLEDVDMPHQWDTESWPAVKERFSEIFRTRTRNEWAEAFADSDACGAPVLTFEEAPHHPHHVARETYIEQDGVIQPAPAPRFGRTPASLGHPPKPAGFDTEEILREVGCEQPEINDLVASGAVFTARDSEAD